MLDYLRTVIDAIIAQNRTSRRLGRRVTLYTVNGDALRGVLIGRSTTEFELRSVSLAQAGADKFKPLLHPVSVPAQHVAYYVTED